jgi:hypothetical protein
MEANNVVEEHVVVEVLSMSLLQHLAAPGAVLAVSTDHLTSESPRSPQPIY